MTASLLSSSDVQRLRQIVDQACSSSTQGLPCANLSLIVNNNHHKTDELHYQVPSTANGQVGAGKEGTVDDIYWLASCTKLATTIACMQLVEKGVVDLDSGDQLEDLCPELCNIKVLQQDGTLVEKKRQITLRMLLTHTAGFGYSFLSPALQAFRQQQSPSQDEFDEFSGNFADFDQPLIHQPGETFEYGISLDWAGVLVERASKLKLGDYMTRYIFNPLGIRNISMTPSIDMLDRLPGIWKRKKEGNLSPRSYPLQKPLNPAEQENIFHSGGAGLFGNIREFSEILRALLNNGAAPDGQRILSAASVEEMFHNQLVDQPDFARRPLPTTKPELAHPAPGLYPLCPADKPQGYGLGGMITPSVTGRSEVTMQWSGLSNIFWWCDREKGVAGIVASQILPFADVKVIDLWVQLEQALYTMMEKDER